MTHCHGDHTFGLPGLLCLIGQDLAQLQRATTRVAVGGSEGVRASKIERNNYKKSKVIEIYGPSGLRRWLRETMRYSRR
jgi:ribonuclease Z